ncbi:hypothetical protein, partial [Aquimarina agarilytica]|uniref:hypothetical protein n=1 Tax=Aquimarina agarilytica TaxID=1087449 RepID=UPI00028917A8
KIVIINEASLEVLNLIANKKPYGEYDKEKPAIIGELSFIFLPFIVILIINLNKENFSDLLQTADWSLASAILFGQTIVKLIMGVSAQEHSFEYQRFGLLSALIIVLGLIPSVVIIGVFETTGKLGLGLIILQFVLLIIAVWAFIILGTIGQHLYSSAFKNKIAKMLGINKKSDVEK